MFKFIVDCKTETSVEIDWEKLFQIWPFLTKSAVNKLLTYPAMLKQRGMPLYKQAENVLNSLSYGSRSARMPDYQRKLELVEAFDQLREDQRKENSKAEK